MKTLCKLKPEIGVWLHEIDEPVCGPNEVKIKISKTGICGTDIHIYNWDEWSQATIPIPMTVGHEYMGVIVEIGSEVKGFKEGDRVSGEGHISCGFCRNCREGRRHLCHETISVGVTRPGAFAEYIVIPAENAFQLPDNISDDLASIFDPFGNATHSALSFDIVGEDVLITGAGPIGCMSVAIAKHAGARHIVITDMNEYRLKLAKEMGATVALNIKEDNLSNVMKRLEMKEGFDVGLEMSGSGEAFNDMVTHMVHGGNIALLGIPPTDTRINWKHVIFRGLTIKGIYGREMFKTWYKMASMLGSGLDISPVITHHFKLADYEAAFEVMRSGESGKVIIDWL